MGRHRASKVRSVRSRAVRTALAAVAAVGTVGVAGLTAAPAVAATAAGQSAGFRFADITASDGVVLKANVIEPGGSGLHPAVVFVNSWGLNDLEYLAQATKLAQRGYTVLSYTTRGFWGSGGQIDTAGPKDIGDVSTVIDWMLADTSADPGRIGVAGVSYGAGISLIAAAHDPRIKAVTAMSAWTDLVYSLYGNQTRHLQATGLLDIAAKLTGHPSPELTQMINDMYTNQNIGDVEAWAKVRSADTYIDQLNANGTAVYIANAFGDSLFGPDQLVDFYNRLTVPDKRLDLAPGDHATVEGLGLAALPNAVWANVGDWLDEHVAGTKTGVRDGVMGAGRGRRRTRWLMTSGLGTAPLSRRGGTLWRMPGFR
jgi:dienelactone hydrolase